MYLSAKVYLSSHIQEEKTARKEIIKLFPEFANLKVTNVTFALGYWRKAYAIHDWFVEIIGWEDDYTSVDLKQLEELKSLCEQVIKDPSKAKELLPIEDNDYNKYYFDDLKETIKIVDEALSLPECQFIYFAG